MRMIYIKKNQNTLRNVYFCAPCSYRLFKRALHERAGVLSVDAVTGDGHQVTSAGHGVAQERKVAIVHIGTIKGDDVVQLSLQSLAHCLNTEHL